MIWKEMHTYTHTLICCLLFNGCLLDHLIVQFIKISAGICIYNFIPFMARDCQRHRLANNVTKVI